MATTGTEKHFRLCLVLLKAGTKAACSLLLKRVKDLCPVNYELFSWTLDEFLMSKKKKILKARLGREKIQILFPSGTGTDLSQWDLSLLCCILTQFCELPRLTCLDVERLRTLRNELCHVNEPTIDDKNYMDCLKTIRVVISRILEETDEECTKCEIERIVKDIETEPLSLEETLRQMHKFYAMERDIREKLDQMSEVEETVLAKVENFDRLLHKNVEKLDTKLDEINRSMQGKQQTAPNSFVFPCLDFYIELMNLSPEKEANMSKVLVQLFEEAISEDEDFKSQLPVECYVKLREVVNKTVQLFQSRGWQIVRTRRKCVLLDIQCTSFSSLSAFFREYTQSRFELELGDLKGVISEMTNEENVALEPVIYKDEFLSVMNDTLSSLEEYLATDGENDAALTDEDHADDEDVDTAHSLLLTAKRHRPENLSNTANDFEKENVQDFIKDMENELLREFDEQDLCLRTKYIERPTIKASDCATNELKNAASDETDEEIVPEVQMLNWLSRTDSMEDHSFRKAEDQYECRLQTIAIVELYRTQLNLANYLELAYLNLYDQRNLAEKVRLIASSAKDLHKMSMGWISKMHQTAAKIKGKLSLLSDALSVQQAKLLEIKLTQLIPLAENMVMETENLRKSYKDVKMSVQKTIGDVESGERSMEEEPQWLVEYAQKERNEESQFMYSIMGGQIMGENKSAIFGETEQLQRLDNNSGNIGGYGNKQKVVKEAETISQKDESNDPGSEQGAYAIDKDPAQEHEDFGVIIDEIMLAATLTPGTAMTGGIKGQVFEKLNTDTNFFDMFNHRSDRKSLDSLLKCYTDSQTTPIHEPCQQPTVFVMMHKHQAELTNRLETLKKQGLDSDGILRETLVQLHYIDVQLARIGDCWTTMTALMKTVSEMLSTSTSSLAVSLYRFVELISNISLSWGCFESICQDYQTESDSQITDLYKFLLVSVDLMSSRERNGREQKLMHDVEERISRTFPSGLYFVE